MEECIGLERDELGVLAGGVVVDDALCHVQHGRSGGEPVVVQEHAASKEGGVYVDGGAVVVCRDKEGNKIILNCVGCMEGRLEDWSEGRWPTRSNKKILQWQSHVPTCDTLPEANQQTHRVCAQRKNIHVHVIVFSFLS